MVRTNHSKAEKIENNESRFMNKFKQKVRKLCILSQILQLVNRQQAYLTFEGHSRKVYYFLT